MCLYQIGCRVLVYLLSMILWYLVINVVYAPRSSILCIYGSLSTFLSGGGGLSLVYLGSTYRPQGVTRHWHSPKYHHE